MIKEELKYTITPSKLDINSLYEFLIHNCNYFDVVVLALMLNDSKELIKGISEPKKYIQKS